MSAAYVQAAIPEPFRILGLKLKPFSFGHYLILKRFDCAFVSEVQASATRDDLIFCVLVCSMSHDEFLKFIERKDIIKQIRKWGRRIGWFDLKEKALLLQQYIDQGTQQPKFWILKEDDKPGGAHWSQVIATTLRGKVGYTRDDLMNCPLTQAFSDFYKHAEECGVIRLMTEAEAEAVKESEATSGA